MSPAATPTSSAPETDAGTEEISLLALLRFLVDNLRLLIILPLLAGCIALGIAFLVTPTFTATTSILPPQQQQSSATAVLQSLGALGGLATAATGLKNPNDQFIALLSSETIANTLIDRFDLVKRYDAELKADARKELASVTSITSGKGGLITVEVNDPSPQFAAELANAYVEQFSQLLSRLAVTEAQQRRAFFEAQMDQARQKLAAAEVALKSSGVNASALKSSPEATVRAVAELQAKVVEAEVRLSSMRGYLSANAPDVRIAQTELAALRAQLAKLDHVTDAPAGGGNANDADYVVRYRNFKYFETLFELFAKQFEVAKIDEAREGALVQVVDRALPPERKSKPRKALIAIVTTLVTGLLLLLFLAIRQSLRDARAHPSTAQDMGRLDSSWRRALGRT